MGHRISAGAMGWIKCSEQMPKRSNSNRQYPVLVYANNEIMIGEWWGGDAPYAWVLSKESMGYRNPTPPTYWHELPATPTGESV